MSYIPKVNDYVKWRNHQGWVYFKDIDNEYITIEIGVKIKPKSTYSRVQLHRKDHILIVCHSEYWNELKYIKSRKSIYHED